jgi:uridine kinase
MSPDRRAVLEEVAARVPDLAPDGVRVGIDGVDGAGKTVFADHLAAVLSAAGRPVVRVSVDDFHHPRAVRHRRGRLSPEGFWLDSYDYPALCRRVLDPFGPGESRRYQPACHDLASDQQLESPVGSAPPGAVLVIDGLFLHRDELDGVWDLSVFLQAPFAVSVARMAVRDGSHPDPKHPSVVRYVEGQRLYFDVCRPWERADLVVDASDLDAPVVLISR